MNDQPTESARASTPRQRSDFSHYLPRLRREFYQADAVVFWTLPISHRQQGWLNDVFHAAFREMMLHAAAREGLLCPAYCLMPDHLHLVWMGLRRDADQRNGMKFLRAQLGPFLKPAKFQHQPHDHVLTAKERQRHAFTLACADYVLLNPLKAGLVKAPEAWPHLGAVIPGYPRVNVFEGGHWPWYWKHYFMVREPGIEKRILPPREME
jgi:REP element-mobilizing transposase RayT